MLCRVEFSVAHVRMLAAVIPLLLTVSASHSSGDEIPPSRICIDSQDDCPDIVVSWRWNKYDKLVAKWSNPVFLATVEYASSMRGCDVEWDVMINDGGSSRISCHMTVSGQAFEDDAHSTWYRIQTVYDDHCSPVFNVSLQIQSCSCKAADVTHLVKFYAVNTSTIVSSASSTLDRSTTKVSQPTFRTTPGPPSSITRSSTKGPPSPSIGQNNTSVVTAGNTTLDVFSTTIKAVLNASMTAVTEQNNGAIESTATTASSDQRTVILSSPNILATTETITTVVNLAVRPSGSPAVSSATTRSGQAGGTSVEAASQTVVAAVTRANSEKRSEASTVRKPSTGGGELAKSDAVTSSGNRAESSSFQRPATDATFSTSASRELPTLTPTGTASLPVERSSGSPTVSPAPGAAPSPAFSSQLSPIGDQTSMGMSTKQSDDAQSYTSSTCSSEVASSTSAQHKSSLASSSPSSTVATSSTTFVQSSAARSSVTAAAAAATAATTVHPSDNGGSSAVSSTGYQSTSSTTAVVTSQRTTTSVTSLGPSTAASSSTVTLPTSGSSARTTPTGAETSVGSTPQSTSTITTASTSLSAESSSAMSMRQEALTSPDNSEEDDDTSTVSTPTRATPTTTAKQVVRQSTPETTTGARSGDVATTAGSEVVTSTGATSAESSSSAPRTSATSIDDSATTVTIAGGLAPYTVSVVDGERTTKSSSRLTSVKSSIAQESATSVTGSSRDDSTSAGKMTSEHSTSAVTSNDTRSMTRILVRFRIVNMSFEPNLSDVNSPEYNALNMKLSLLLMEVYRVGVGSMFFNISNMEFTEGSVKVQHSLLLDGSWDDGMLNRTQSALQRTLARSNMTVDSFEMKPISPPGPTELSKPPPTTDQILLISLVCGLLGVLVACIIAVTILLCRQRARRRRRSRSSKGSGSTSTISDRSSKSSSEHVRPPDFSGTALPRVDAHLWMKNNTIRGMGLDRPKTSNYFEHPTRLARVLDDDDNYDALPISIRNKNHNWQQQKDDKQRQCRQAVDSLRHNKRRLGDQHVAPSVEQASNSMAPSDRQHAEVDQDWRFAGGFGGNYGYFDGSMQQPQQQPQQAATDRPVNLYGRKLWKPPGYISRQAFGEVDPTTTGAGDHQQPAPSQDSAEMRRRESASQTDSEILVEIDAIYGQRYTRSRDRNRARQQARVSRVGAANGAVRPPGIGRSLHANSVQGDQIEMPNVYGMRQQAASPTNSRQPDMLHRDVYLP